MSNRPGFAAIIAYARRVEHLTAAEMDHSLAMGDGTAMAALGNAAYRIANEHLPEVTPATNVDELLGRRLNADALIDATTPDRDAMVADAKTRSFTGWSDASRGPIRYAR